MQDGVSAATAHKITASGASLSAGSGVFVWLSENHALIASIGVLTGMVIGVIGLILQNRINKRREAREIEARAREIEIHMARMAEFKSQRDGQRG